MPSFQVTLTVILRMLEASIRKITVKVTWKEGIQKRDISVIQYVTKPMRGDAITAAAAASGGLPGMTAPALPGGFPGATPGLPSPFGAPIR